MKTFDLSLVQEEARREIQAGSDILDVIDDLVRLKGVVAPEAGPKIDELVDALTKISRNLVTGGGNVNRSIMRFLSQ